MVDAEDDEVNLVMFEVVEGACGEFLKFEVKILIVGRLCSVLIIIGFEFFEFKENVFWFAGERGDTNDFTILGIEFLDV